MIQKVGVLYNPKRQNAHSLAHQIANLAGQLGASSTILPAWDEDAIRRVLPEWQLVITCGGDGTILRMTRLAAPLGIPQLGINLGNLGFLAEIQPDEIEERLPAYFDNECWIEERAMLSAEVRSANSTGQRPDAQFDALNDVLVARASHPRIIRVRVMIDDIEYGVLNGDGVIVATATGSTAYALAAGGPVLAPTLRSPVLVPVCVHVTRAVPLVLPPEASVSLQVVSGFPAIMSIDGQIDRPLTEGDEVSVKLSPHTARFLRAKKPDHFYSVLGRILR